MATRLTFRCEKARWLRSSQPPMHTPPDTDSRECRMKSMASANAPCGPASGQDSAAATSDPPPRRRRTLEREDDHVAHRRQQHREPARDDHVGLEEQPAGAGLLGIDLLAEPAAAREERQRRQAD